MLLAKDLSWKPPARRPYGRIASPDFTYDEAETVRQRTFSGRIDVVSVA